MAIPTEHDKLIAQTLAKESDRGCVILGAALLADALEDLLRSFCRDRPEDVKATIDPLFEGYAPLSTFSARIQIAFALGILPRQLRDKIDLVRRLRNDFAHEWGPIDFEDPKCASRLELLIGRAEKLSQEAGESSQLSGLAVLAPTKEQLVTRIVFGMYIIRLETSVNSLASFAREGRDVRAIVIKGEREGLWE
jgi:DNA-binding MltR family transcriptional regulator